MKMFPGSGKVPPFEEFLRKIALVPAPDASEAAVLEVVHVVRDESNNISYKLVSDHRLSPAEVRACLASAFKRTEVWVEDAGEIEIRV